MANIRKGDLVQVISGPTQERGGDRGKQGRVIEVQLEKNRLIVEGVNFVTKHVRVGQTQRGTKTGGIETHEAPIHVSNVALVNPDTKLPARVGFTVETDKQGKTTRVRYFKDSRRVASKKATKATKSTKSESTVDTTVAIETDAIATDVIVPDVIDEKTTKAPAAPKAASSAKAAKKDDK